MTANVDLCALNHSAQDGAARLSLYCLRTCFVWNLSGTRRGFRIPGVSALMPLPPPPSARTHVVGSRPDRALVRDAAVEDEGEAVGVEYPETYGDDAVIRRVRTLPVEEERAMCASRPSALKIYFVEN